MLLKGDQVKPISSIHLEGGFHVPKDTVGTVVHNNLGVDGGGRTMIAVAFPNIAVEVAKERVTVISSDHRWRDPSQCQQHNG